MKKFKCDVKTSVRLTTRDEKLLRYIDYYFKIPSSKALRISLRKYWKPLVLEENNKRQSEGEQPLN